MNRSGYQLKLNLFLSTGWGPLQTVAKRIFFMIYCFCLGRRKYFPYKWGVSQITQQFLQKQTTIQTNKLSPYA